MEMKAAVTAGKGMPFSIERVQLEDPKEGEVLVRIVASGTCHTDMIARDQEYPVPLPAVLGHEGAGVVEKVGDGVKSVVEGDHVVLSFAYCGGCKSCLTGHPYACENFFELNFVGDSSNRPQRIQWKGEYVTTFFGQSSFGTYALTGERNVVKVDKEVDLRLLGPLGCGIQTGAGSVLNTLRPQVGSSLACFGCGAVGLSAMMAAKAIGCTPLIAIDIHDNRLRLAEELGATHTINGKDQDAVKTIREITGKGVDYSVETTGVAFVLKQAVESLTFMGKAAVIGAPPIGTTVELDINDVLVQEKTITGVVEGDSVPQIFIPQLIALYKQGKFPFDKLIRFYELEDINEAIRDSETGLTIKPVIQMPH
ncbi:NAD(P)-dependent alcohol dehydrogenase [Paenactinomyces guangxiensis]|uniref:NAD(P)-dependent alcohol dehydrogenase n=1 Tax=Paenactinomyces guangxiensis TaxID=1490290 RepID=A0A7W2AAY3_9BACL|nr:NAD(P)-dependent alcohol dehydrogenase [Paenactinomyces guangxiensis]MBA4496338.1 NAD(P)-dependent alcohol dehydrogenase [Paenactinomyces guangxiensis]MBH8593622.1 NAD(P)-dependent alcohol dehydrogenase [Paenactinomyces guangxiensis]